MADQQETCRYCGAEAEQGMDNGAWIIWTCMGHEDDGSPVDPVMQARRRYNRAVNDHYANLYGDEEWADVPQSETYHKMRTLGEAFEQSIREQERSRYEGLLAAADESDQSVMIGEDLRRLSWREVAERARAESLRANAYLSVLSDLSRCEHGRHLGDMCSSCGGPSIGNTILTPGMVVGHDISGRPITVPARAQFASADEWRTPSAPAEGTERGS